MTNEAIALVDPAESIGITANLWFAIASTFFTAIVVTLVTHRIVEPRLGAYHPNLDPDDAPVAEAAPPGDVEAGAGLEA